MGAAGLTSSAVEMASKGEVGIELNMDRVPCREEGMTPYEMMLSESQERMLMVLKPGCEAEAEAIFKKWELDFAIIGRVTDSKHMVLTWKGDIVCDIPLAPLADNAPCYDRPWVATPKAKALGAVPASGSITDNLVTLVGSPDLASRRWIWEQYDNMVGADTVQRPGGDAAVVRVHGTEKALAMSVDVTPRYCRADPEEGGKQAVAECYRNITAVGALPLASTDCLNFGNPERPEIMGQIVGAIKGIGEACRALDMPIVSGNVSLYNETRQDDGSSLAILPTPTIGGVGLLQDWRDSTTIAFKNTGEEIYLVGNSGQGHLGQSIWLREIAGREEGTAPSVDLAQEKATGDFIRAMIQDGMLCAVHDISDGGLAVALAEMALAGNIGATVEAHDKAIAEHAYYFGEDQGRYLVSSTNAVALVSAAEKAGIPVFRLGVTGGDAVVLNSQSVSLEKLRKSHEAFLPELMQ